MLNLKYLYNCVMTDLPEFGEINRPYAPVFLKNGDFKRVEWLGYIEREEATGKPNAVPVKLDVRYYSVAPGLWPKWRNVPKGMAVQGCLVAGRMYGEGVYAVVEDGMPRFVPLKQEPEGMEVDNKEEEHPSHPAQQ